MATTAKNREDTEEAEHEDIVPPDWRLRARDAVTRLLLREVDRAIGVMQRARAALAPVDAVADQPSGTTEVKDAPPAQRKAMRPLGIVMVGLMMLLIGAISSAGFSYRLFAQRLDKQADFIANQADEVFEYDKETRKAELALDKAKVELKEIRQAFEENKEDLQQTRVKLAELEGRALLYGNPRATSRPNVAIRTASAAASETLSTNELGGVKRGVKVNDGSCQVGSGSIGQDLSRCLGGH